jgi:hypothetical protein
MARMMTPKIIYLNVSAICGTERIEARKVMKMASTVSSSVATEISSPRKQQSQR